MTQTIALTLNLFDGSGSPVTKGSVVLVPQVQLQDQADGMEIIRAPVLVPLTGGTPVVNLIPTDAPGPQPAGWSWGVICQDVPGHPPVISVLLPAGPLAFTAATGTPGTVTVTPTTGFPAVPTGAGFKFSSGAPAPLVNGTTYYAVSSTGSSFKVAATQGGSPLAFTGTGSGTLTAVSYLLSSLTQVDPSPELSAYMLAPSGSPLAGQVPVTQSDGSQLTTWTTLSAVGAGALPVSQTFALANNAYKPIYEWTVTGQTNALPAFGLVAGSQTYGWASGGESTQGPAFWWGYNARHLSNMVPSSPHAALGVSAFADAGDTWNPATGGHGLEFNVAWTSPSSAKGVAPIEIVGVDDETRTVTLALRCGDGEFTNHDGNPYVSGISMTDAGGNSYLTAGPFNNSAYGSVPAGTAPGVQMGAPLALTNLPYLLGSSAGKMNALFAAQGTVGNGSMTWSAGSNNDTNTVLWSSQTGTTHTVYSVAGPAVSAVTSSAGLATSSVTAAGAGNTAKFQATSPAGTSQFILNGNTTVSAQMVFQKNSANTWVMQDSGGSNFLLSNNSGNSQIFMTSGANTAGNYDNATTFLLSKVVVGGSMVVNNNGTALATTATTGFLYIPTCAGTPTGTPVANAGAVPLVYDTTNNQLNVYRGAAWHAIGI